MDELTPKLSQIDPTGAVKAAYAYLMKVSTDYARYSNFRVEEVQRDSDNDFLITLSYEVTGEFPFDKKKEYKDFKVGKDGTVVSMKIRKP